MKLLLALAAALLLLPIASAQSPENFAIPADSKSPFDFRGTPAAWDFAAYQALFRTKTFGELHEGLRQFMKEWNALEQKPQSPAATEAYFTCKQALIRTYYLFGEVEPADELLLEFRPSKETLANPAATLNREQALSVGKQIREMCLGMGEPDPFPNGIPENIHAIYAPLLKIIRNLSE